MEVPCIFANSNRIGNRLIIFNHPLKTLGGIVGSTSGTLLPLYYAHNMVSTFNLSLPTQASILFASLITYAAAITGTGVGYLFGTALTYLQCRNLDRTSPTTHLLSCSGNAGIALSLLPFACGITGAIGAFAGLFTGINLTNHFYQNLSQPNPSNTAMICLTIELASTAFVTWAMKFACSCLKSMRSSGISNVQTAILPVVAHNNAITTNTEADNFAKRLQLEGSKTEMELAII